MIVGTKNINGINEPDIKEGSIFQSFVLIPNTDTYEVFGLTRWGNSPFSITSAQGKLQLTRLGLLAYVQGIIDEMDEQTKIYWKEWPVWERTSPIIARIAPYIFPEDTENKLDEFFEQASRLR